MILVALAAVAIVAFVALAVDGGTAYSLRREAQSAADSASLAGTWAMISLPPGSDPQAPVLRQANAKAEVNGVPDTNGVPGDVINDNIQAFYVDSEGNRVDFPELHDAGGLPRPSNARGVEVVTAITTTTFFARAVGVSTVGASAHATARYEIDGGILPIAVNQYWYGPQGQPHFCPYDNCGEPYSFVRNPSQLPPFGTSDGGITWYRNVCPDPWNENTCQGPYEGYGENFGKAFPLMGQDAYPNYGSRQPRSAVVIDVRYNALTDGGTFHQLVSDNNWLHDVHPIPQGQGMQDMQEVILQGGYRKVPLPRAAQEPPTLGYIDGWGYCWKNPPSVENCFNYPEEDRSEPYDGLQFLYGTEASKMAMSMYDDGNYVDGRYAPGQHLVIMVYNSSPGQNWGSSGKSQDVAVIVGYFGAVIVGYGNDFTHPCEGTPGDWESYVHCVERPGNSRPSTVYGMADPSAPLTIDPSKLLEDFLPKKIVLIR